MVFVRVNLQGLNPGSTGFASLPSYSFTSAVRAWVWYRQEQLTRFFRNQASAALIAELAGCPGLWPCPLTCCFCPLNSSRLVWSPSRMGRSPGRVSRGSKRGLRQGSAYPPCFLFSRLGIITAYVIQHIFLSCRRQGDGLSRLWLVIKAVDRSGRTRTRNLGGVYPKEETGQISLAGV